MSIKRVSQSTVDWAKMAKKVGSYQQGHFNKFKGRTDLYLRKVAENPETPPQVDFAAYKKLVNNKAAIDALEQSYKSLSIQYPADTKSAEIDAQEKQLAVEGKKRAELLQEKISEAEDLLNKFKLMIPVDKMTPEEFVYTFPDWSITEEAPSMYPHLEKTPGITKKDRLEIKEIMANEPK